MDFTNKVLKDNHQSFTFNWKLFLETYLPQWSMDIHNVSWTWWRSRSAWSRCLPVASSRLRFAAVFTRSVEVLLTLAISTRPKWTSERVKSRQKRRKLASCENYLFGQVWRVSLFSCLKFLYSLKSRVCWCLWGPSSTVIYTNTPEDGGRDVQKNQSQVSHLKNIMILFLTSLFCFTAGLCRHVELLNTHSS